MSFEDQIQLHPSGEVFRDHLMTQVKTENKVSGDIMLFLFVFFVHQYFAHKKLTPQHPISKMLRARNKQIGPARDFLTKITIRLRNAVFLETKLPPIMDIQYYSACDSVSCPIKSEPLPLMEFADGEVSMLGQSVGYFPGSRRITLLENRVNSILVRFCLSNKCSLEGVLQGLSDEDMASYETKQYASCLSHRIIMFLSSGRGLENPGAISFTPLMIHLDVSTSTLKLLTPLPSLETIIKDFTFQVNMFNSSWRQSRTAKKKPRPKLPLFTPMSEDSRLTTLAALGCTDIQMEILAENRVLSLENNRMRLMQEYISTVIVSHPAFTIKVSLKNGVVANTVEGEEIWRIFITGNVAPESINIRNISRLAMSISGVRMKPATLRTRPFRAGDDQLACFWSRFRNGVMLKTNIYPSQDLLFPHISAGLAVIVMTIDFPLNTVSHILEVLGVQV